MAAPPAAAAAPDAEKISTAPSTHYFTIVQLNGRRQQIRMELLHATTVGALKIKIQEELGIPFKQQCLVNTGRVLQDQETLDTYVWEDIIHLIRRPLPAT